MKKYDVSKARNMEKGSASNARPSQGSSSVKGGTGAKSRGTDRIPQRTPGKVITK